MSALAELTLHDGRRVGITTGGALIISEFKEPPPEMPKAKTMIRWFVPGAKAAYHSYVRDDLRQVRNLFPVAFQGLGWAEVEDVAGNTVLIPAGSAQGGYQEVEDGLFQLELAIPTGPVSLQVRATFEEVRKLAGMDATAAAPAKAEKPAKPPKPAAKRPAGEE